MYATHNNFWRKLVASLCLVGTGLMVTPSYAQQEANQGEHNRRTLKFGGKEKSRVYKACERTIKMNLIGYATTGDIKSACTCLDRVYQTAYDTLPKKYHKRFLYNRPEGEVVRLQGINSLEQSDRVPQKVQVVASTLAWEARSCLSVLPVRDQVLGLHPRRWGPDSSMYALNIPVIAPVEGPAQPVNKDLGGLHGTKLTKLWIAITNLAERLAQPYTRESNSKYLKMHDKFGRAARYEAQQLDKDIGKYILLECSYRAQSENGFNRWLSSQPYYYWYEPYLKINVAQLTEGLSEDNTIHHIGAPRKTCPPQEPKGS